MADLSQVNIIACLNYLRPGSSFGWGGDGDAGNQYSAIFEWRDPNTTQPTEQEILDAWVIVQAQIASEATIRSARQDLRDKIALAHDSAFAPVIKSLFNATLDNTLGQVGQPARFTAIQTIVNAAPNAFKNRFITDLQEELGIDYATISTTTQQRQASFFARVWSTQLALLLSQ